MWLRQYLTLPGGIPTHDTFNRFFSALYPEQFESAFLSWIKDISEITCGEIVSIDGKTICGSRNKGSKRAVHLVSAWSKANQLSSVETEAVSGQSFLVTRLLSQHDWSE